MEFLHTRLENGLEIIAECNPHAHGEAVGLFVRTGARDETDDLAGVSHFLEHMTFKGTTTRTAEELNRAFDDIGAYCNAFTTEENTVYFAAMLPEYQDRTLELLADMLQPALRPEDFETEKLVILEEIRMYEDQPPFGADEKCRALFFGRHPLGRNILGTVESILGMSVEKMRQYWYQRYVPGNITLAAAGRVDFDRLVASARRYCGHWEPRPVCRELVPVQPHQHFQILQKPSASQQYVIQLAAAPGAADPRRYAAGLLATILGDETGSRLFWALVDTGLAETATLTYSEYREIGLFTTCLISPPELMLKNFQMVREIYARAASSEPIRPDELQLAKTKICSHLVLSSELCQNRLFALAAEWVQRARYLSLQEELDAIRQVSLDQVQSLLTDFPLNQAATITIGPLTHLEIE
ncbi:MAG: insulinase family protein [Thermoguttaceae bacterium]|nr:insulinase family protein [Thermoguttaceae bacterium]MDW8038358.1 pitrilysin family protein [Thermoguttaceae bacterium]